MFCHDQVISIFSPNDMRLIDYLAIEVVEFPVPVLNAHFDCENIQENGLVAGLSLEVA